MPNLRDQIRDYYDAQTLSAEKAEAILRGEAGEKILPFPGRFRKGLLALAALLVVFGGLSSWLVVRENDNTSFAMIAPGLVEFFQTPPDLKQSQNKEELRQWLLAGGAPADFHVPAKLMPLESVGCRVLDMHGHPAYLTCFWREQKPGAAKTELIHLLAVRRSDFHDAPRNATPRFRELAGWSFASWSEGNVAYTVATPAPMEKLRPFVLRELSQRRALVAAISF